MSDFDPIKYGMLWQRVQDIDIKMDKLETQVEQLLELANRGKGGLWFGMMIVSAVSAFIGYVLNYFKH